MTTRPLDLSPAEAAAAAAMRIGSSTRMGLARPIRFHGAGPVVAVVPDAAGAGVRWAAHHHLGSRGGVRCEERRCPWGVPGDLLYVRERWVRHGGRAAHAADISIVNAERWRPSRSMLRWAARTWLRLVGVDARWDPVGPHGWTWMWVLTVERVGGNGVPVPAPR